MLTSDNLLRIAVANADGSPVNFAGLTPNANQLALGPRAEFYDPNASPRVIYRVNKAGTGFETAAGGGGITALSQASDYNANLVTPLAAVTATANAALPASQKGVANGVAGLDGTGKVPVAQLPAAIVGALNYQGTYNATTNTPAIVAGNKGFFWTVATAGTSLGINWLVGDKVVDNGTSIEKIDGNTGEVITVGGQSPNASGNVSLALANLSDGATQQAAITAAANGVTTLTAAATVQADNAQTGTTYTFALTDAGQQVDLNNASAIAATIPPHSSVAFPAGTLLYWSQVGAGVVTITAGAGVTFTKPSSRSYSTSAQLEGGYAYQVSQDNWRIYNN